MYAGGGTTIMGTPRKHKLTSSTGYLARPKLGALKNIYTNSKLNLNKLQQNGYGMDKRKKIKKPATPSKLSDYRKKPDYADTAYREAVSRLRILLAESYVPVKRHFGRDLEDDTDNQSIISGVSRVSRYPHYHSTYLTKKFPISPRYGTTDVKSDVPAKYEAPPEFSAYIERQEEYIDQLEKESRFCREELSTLLSKVKDVIVENESLHEKQKNYLMKSVFDQFETETETENEDFIKKKSKQHIRLEGPAIVFESRISELEAQLTQTKIELKKAQDENDALNRKHLNDPYSESDECRKQVDTLQRDKNILQDTVTKLQTALNILRDKEHSSSDQVKRSLDVAEQAQYERNSAEHEIRRLKDELDRQHGKMREVISEQGRRVADERSAVERRYTQQIEQLTTELGVHWEQNSKLQLELDKQRRENGDLRRELAQKQALIDELKKDMQNKIVNLQSDIGVTGAEKSALEGHIASLQMANERCERNSKQETARLQVEIQSLRQRLDRADGDLIHSKRENVRLMEQIASLEKEIKMNAALADEKSKRFDVIALPPPSDKSDAGSQKEMSTMIQDMEAKHVATVAELEGMIQSQNQLMDKLSEECHALTQKLEENSARHKEEIRELQTNLNYLTSRFKQSDEIVKPSADKEKTFNNGNTAQLITNTAQNSASAPSHNLDLNNQNIPEQQQQQQQLQPEQQQQFYDNSQEYVQGDENYQYDPSMYKQDEYDPNQQYLTQEQYNQQYGDYLQGNEMYEQQQYVADADPAGEQQQQQQQPPQPQPQQEQNVEETTTQNVHKDE